MNGYAWPTYGSVRYMQPILTAQDAPVSIYDAFQVLYGPPPGVTPAWAEAGTIPPLTIDDIPWDGSGEIEPTSIPGTGIPIIDEGLLIPTAPVAPEEVQGWTPTGFVDVTLADDGEYPWRIYVGGYLVEKWSDGRLRLALGRASTLEFTREDSAGNRAVFTLTNPIELRNSYDLLVDVFEISVLRQQREPDKALLHIEAIGSLSRLGMATVLEYSTPVDAETGARSYMRVRDIVAALFEYQSADYPLAIGEIDPAIGDREVIWSCEACTVLGALEQLQQHLPIEIRGHYFAVPDDAGVLQFRWILGTSGIPMTMDTETNLSGIEYSQDFTQIITRLYLRGQQQELGTRVDLPAPGYLSRNEALYGVRAAAKIDNRILYQESLIAYGERLLDEYSTPKTELRVTGINTEIGGHDARLVTLGTRYDVTDAISEVTVSVVAQEIEYDLDDPLSLSLTLSSRTREMADLMADVVGQLNEEPLSFVDAFAAAFAEAFPPALDEALPPALDEALPGALDEALPGALDEALPPALDDAFPRCRITAITDNYLVCERVDTEAVVNVAKAYSLRRNSFDGQTKTYEDGSVISYAYDSGRSRTATKDGAPETQVMTPDYFVGEEIRVLPGDTGDLDLDTNAIVFDDCNTCGRHWAKKAT